MKRKTHGATAFAMIGLVAIATSALAQDRPYIGFVYPAGGKQGTTFPIKLGGQGMDNIVGVMVSGAGVTGKITEYNKKLGPQEITLLREQLAELEKAGPAGDNMMEVMIPTADESAATEQDPNNMMMADMAQDPVAVAVAKGDTVAEMIAKIRKRIAGYVQTPASVSISNIALGEITVAPDAIPGERELRVITHRGISTPIVFHIGQLPEYTRKPMATSPQQILGKEYLAMRKRPADEVEVRVEVPCALNGQIASAETNFYRFNGRKGQKLVITCYARNLVPYIADAVPGWFQAVLALYDGQGREVAYNDDFRFRPDPTILFEVPNDGEYVLAVYDSIYRGREDFVYRINIGELPFITSIYPLGTRQGEPVQIKLKGWNLGGDELTLPTTDLPLGIFPVTAARPDGFVSNRVPFAIDRLPEVVEQEPNSERAQAQKIDFGTIINGRIDQRDDRDFYQVEARAGDTLVAEVLARRLDSPVDSSIRVMDASGKVLSFSDDVEDFATGLNTHHADSYIMCRLPADGTYFVCMTETGRSGGEEYTYRLRISPPQPDFHLRAVPSSVAIRRRGTGSINVYAIRKDGFDGAIKISVKNTGSGLSGLPVTLTGDQEMAKFNVRADIDETPEPIPLIIEGRATVDGRTVVRDAMPTEDRMQAFLWRHLVPTKELRVLIYDPNAEPVSRRPVPKIVSN